MEEKGGSRNLAFFWILEVANDLSDQQHELQQPGGSDGFAVPLCQCKVQTMHLKSRSSNSICLSHTYDKVAFAIFKYCISFFTTPVFAERSSGMNWRWAIMNTIQCNVTMHCLDSYLTVLSCYSNESVIKSCR